MTTAPATASPAIAAFDVETVRADFPALTLTAHGHPLAYLDNAATSQKPRQVLEALDRTYREANANVHRGVHLLAERATAGYEAAREKVARYLGAAETAEIVFTRGTTESVNLVAQAFARPRLQPGDEVLITHLEHHSNIVPWQLVCEATGARLRVAPINDRGEVDLDAFAALLGEHTKMVAVAHISNALGTVNPVARVVELAHGHGVPVLIDGAQAVPHRRVDVRAIGCDFYAFSGHKAFGPTGIGALYGRREHLEAMPPYQGGGEMIRTVTFERTEFAPPPARFEAGTPNIVGAIGLGATIDYLDALDLDRTGPYEQELLAYATGRLSRVPGVRLVGTARDKAGVLAFTVDGIHPHDVGTVLDRQGVAVRAGHHCAQPVMQRFGVTATVRASFAFYNTVEEADRLVAGVRRAQEIFGA
ncbi:MAG: SufS family cysteine desulfurase [Thermoanaerobaculia bacterium]